MYLGNIMELKSIAHLVEDAALGVVTTILISL